MTQGVIEKTSEQLEDKVSVTLPYEEGLIVVFTGVKGSGKTANLAAVAMVAMAEWQKPVYSNLPIGGYLMGKYYEVSPLPDNFFVTYGRGVEPRAVIIVTELGEYFNNQDWQQLQSKMGVSMFAQIRKLNLHIFGDTQFFHHLNPRLAEQVDVLVRCQDLSKTPWGREHKVGKGVEALLEYFDLSGDVSPNGKSARSEFQPNVISGKSYKSEVAYIKAYWEYYDSHKLVALEQRFKKFYIEKEKVKVPELISEAANTAESTKSLRNFLTEVFNEAAKSGVAELKAQDVFQMVYADGFNVGQKELGMTVHALGIKSQYRSHCAAGQGTYYTVKEIGKQ